MELTSTMISSCSLARNRIVVAFQEQNTRFFSPAALFRKARFCFDAIFFSPATLLQHTLVMLRWVYAFSWGFIVFKYLPIIFYS